MPVTTRKLPSADSLTREEETGKSSSWMSSMRRRNSSSLRSEAFFFSDSHSGSVLPPATLYTFTPDWPPAVTRRRPDMLD